MAHYRMMRWTIAAILGTFFANLNVGEREYLSISECVLDGQLYAHTFLLLLWACWTAKYDCLLHRCSQLAYTDAFIPPWRLNTWSSLQNLTIIAPVQRPICGIEINVSLICKCLTADWCNTHPCNSRRPSTYTGLLSCLLKSTSISNPFGFPWDANVMEIKNEMRSQFVAIHQCHEFQKAEQRYNNSDVIIISAVQVPRPPETACVFYIVHRQICKNRNYTANRRNEQTFGPGPWKIPQTPFSLRFRKRAPGEIKMAEKWRSAALCILLHSLQLWTHVLINSSLFRHFSTNFNWSVGGGRSGTKSIRLLIVCTSLFGNGLYSFSSAIFASPALTLGPTIVSPFGAYFLCGTETAKLNFVCFLRHGFPCIEFGLFTVFAF